MTTVDVSEQKSVRKATYQVQRAFSTIQPGVDKSIKMGFDAHLQKQIITKYLDALSSSDHPGIIQQLQSIKKKFEIDEQISNQPNTDENSPMFTTNRI